MREINKISEALFEKIRDRFEDVSLGDEKAKATQNPEDARFFNFDYVVDGENHGNITLSLIDEVSLKVYFSKNISHDLEGEDREEWYSFLRELREFAKRNLLSFEPRDITRSTLKHRDLQQVSKADSTYSKDEVVSESRMWGSMNRSYEDFGPVRIKVAHTKPIVDETNGARSRNIEAIFVENDQGERFRMPFNSLVGARAMARHISAGGTPTDEFGCHIREMVEEMLTLRPFVHSMRHRQFEDATTNGMLESAFEYHGLLKSTLKKMKGKRGYNEYKETYQPALTETGDYDQDELRDKFVKKVFPTKLEAALPIVHKAYQMTRENTNPYAQQFETWADDVSESWDEDEDGEVTQWGVEPINVDELADLFAEELPLGVDAVNAINAVSGIITNNELDNELLQAAQQDPQADARDIVIAWLEENVPAVYQELLQDIGDDPNYPPEQAESTYADPMGGMDGVVHEEEEYCDGCDRLAKDCVCEEHDEDQVESIATAIIRRILGNVSQHSELIRKAGPDGVMNAARDVASFHAPVEELGTSDISNMVREVYNEVGVEYPELAEGRMKDVAIDLEQLTDEEFKAKYGKTKQEMQAALSEGLDGLKKWTAGALAAGTMAGAGLGALNQQAIDNDPYLAHLEQQYQQVIQASDEAYAQGDMTKVKQLEIKKDQLEDEIGNAEAAIEQGVDPEQSAKANLEEMMRLAGL